MEVRTRGSFEIADRELVAEGTDLRVKVLTLAAGQCVSARGVGVYDAAQHRHQLSGAAQRLPTTCQQFSALREDIWAPPRFAQYWRGNFRG